MRANTFLSSLCGLGLALLACAAPAQAFPDFQLIYRPAEVTRGQIIEITDQQLTYWREDVRDQKVDLADCVALINDTAKVKFTDRGLLVLSNGQRFPGEAISGAKAGENVLVWSHRKLGRIEAPLALVRSVSFASTNEPAPADLTDVVMLTNGDRIEAYITALGDPVTMTLASNNKPMSVPMERIASIAMVSPERPSTGRRLWLTDGTVLDVSQFRIGHDGKVRITPAGSFVASTQESLDLNELRAALFDANGATPVAKLEPTSIDGPRTRYVLVPPVATEPNAPIGLSPIEFSGPVTVRYALPSSPVEFVAEATIPPAYRTWGDLVLVVLDDDREVFRARLNRDQASVAVHTRLRGSEMTIRIEEGANGPLQDTVALEHALLLNAR